jgi:hypothetical protein
MSLPLRISGTIVASGLSLWMAVLACFVGCALPVFANSDSTPAGEIQDQADQSSADAMAGMENCPHHHSDGNCPQQPNGGKPGHSGGMSCCLIEITVNPKWNPASLGLVPHAILLRSNPSFFVAKTYPSLNFDSHIWHTGRDTLLATRLLRV